MKKTSLLLFVILLPKLSIADLIRAKDIVSPQVIYKTDSRTESRLYKDSRFREYSKAVAIRVQDFKLAQNTEDSTITDFSKITLGEFAPRLCSDEKFIDQYVLGNCTGFLVGEKTLVTAGHCMFSDIECESYKWAFNFTSKSEDLKTDDVYSCKRVIEQKFEYSDKTVADYAVIELDRPVKGIKPLEYRTSGKPFIGEELVVIGHPMGLPQKTADGAKVAWFNKDERTDFFKNLRLRRNYFTANLDTYGGNSGSPVFNKKSGKVEGILIQGFEDFEWDEKKECDRSIVLKGGPLNSFEKVMRITRVKPLKK